MSFMERRGGLTRFKTGFGIVIRVPSPMILSIDRWIDRSSYRVESSCNKLGKRGEINSRLDRINGIFARDCKVQFIRLSLSLSCVYIETEFHRRKIVAEKLVFQVLGLLNYRA